VVLKDGSRLYKIETTLAAISGLGAMARREHRRGLPAVGAA
jgi:hypothetical protein